VSAVVSVEPAVVVVLLEVVDASVELVVDELVEASVVPVVEVVVVVVVLRLARTVLVGGDEVVVARWCRLVRAAATGCTLVDGGASVAVACALRWRPTVVACQRGSAWAR
jgi:hypothetical protein